MGMVVLDELDVVVVIVIVMMTCRVFSGHRLVEAGSVG